MKLSMAKIPEKVFWLSIVFCAVYTSYRYPFKFATSITSPTYADTPAILQVGKFVVVLLLCGISGFWALTTPIRPKKLILLSSVIVLQLLVLIKSAYAFDISYIEQTFWPLAAIVLVLAVDSVDLLDIDRFLRFLLVFSLVTNAIEVILFVTVGRLPAQGYPHSIIVRFGAWLDAPNDFACILFLLMGWALFRFQGAKRVLIEGLLIACLILTQSLTAYAFFLIAIFLMGIRLIVKRPYSLLLILVLLVLLVLITGSWVPELFQDVLTNKAGSIQGHLQSPSQWLDDWSGWVLFGAPKRVFYEDWWLGSLLNFGVLWLGLCIATMGGMLFWMTARFRKAQGKIHRGFLGGVLFLMLYCVVGSLNLPLLTYFPVNFFFYLFFFLVYLGKLQIPAIDTC